MTVHHKETQFKIILCVHVILQLGDDENEGPY